MSCLGQLRYHFQLAMSVCHTASDGNTMKFYNHKKESPNDKCIHTGEVRSEGMKMRLGVRLHVLQTTVLLAD